MKTEINYTTINGIITSSHSWSNMNPLGVLFLEF